MKQLASLLWKEWFEVRVFLAIGLFVFLGLPFIGGIENYGNHLEILASLWVFMLGGLMAVVIAVGIVVRDLDGRLEEFWRSRPVSTVRWLLVKYFVGLLVVLVALGVPLIVESLVNRKTGSFADPRLMLKFHPFLWAALYSLSFAIASVLRRGAHAAMFSIAVMLLLYFLPSVFPPIHFLSLDYVMDPDRVSAGVWIGFAAGMIALSAIGLLISLSAVRRDWRIESDRKLIYWSIGGALLILFSSAAFQVASNLALLQKVDLPANEQVTWIAGDGSDGILVMYSRFRGNRRFFRKFHVGASSIELGRPIEVSTDIFFYRDTVWLPQHPDIAYASSFGGRPDEGLFPVLSILTLNGDQATVSKQSFPDQTAVPPWSHRMWLYIANDRLYFCGLKLMIFDISDPAQPRLLSTEPITWLPVQGQTTNQSRYDDMGDATSVTQFLPQVPALSPRQRLDLMNQWSGQEIDGDILIANYRNHITSLRLEKLTDTAAIYRKVGRYDPTPVEEMFGYSYGRNAAMNGLFFESGMSGLSQGGTVTVYDITGTRPRPVGHFAFPDDHVYELHPLPDRRLLAAGFKRLYLLGPPPGRK